MGPISDCIVCCYRRGWTQSKERGWSESVESSVAFRRNLCHTLFSAAKYTDSVPQICVHGGTNEAQTFQ